MAGDSVIVQVERMVVACGSSMRAGSSYRYAVDCVVRNRRVRIRRPITTGYSQEVRVRVGDIAWHR
jgi:hypothetical protein